MRRAAAECTLERLRALLGARKTVLVRGPAGIGKSTLVERALRGTPYILGQSLEPLRDLPYHPLTHAFGRSFSGAPSDVAGEVAAELGGRTLVVEDLQWSDNTTLETIGLLAGRVGLVVTSRNGVALGHHADVAVVEVPPLERAAALSLARRLHPDLDSSSRRQLVGLAGGIPLLIEQLAADDEVSPTLIDAVRARVERLPTVTIEQLAVLAIHGRPVPAEWLDAVGAADVVNADALVVAHNECVALTHALVAEAVVDLVDVDVRRQIRQRLATVCADADAARHLLDAGDLVGAATRAEAAAATAAPAEKAQLLELAVEARGNDAAPQLRLDAAAALLVANQPMRAEAIVEPLRGLDSRMAAEAGWHQSQAAWLAGDEDLADQRCTAALALVEGTGDALETRLLIELVAQRARRRRGDPTMIADAARAWEAASATGVDRAKARNLVGLTLSLNGRSGWEEHHQAAAALAREDGDVEQELAAMYWLVSAYTVLGPVRKAIELAAEMVAVTEQLGLRRLHHHFLGAYLVQLLGSGTAPDELVGRARRLLIEDPLFRNRAHVDLALAIALIDRGDVAGARDTLAAARRFVRNDEERSLMCVGDAEVAWAMDDVRGLAGALDELSAYPRGFLGMNAVAESAAIHALIRDPNAIDVPTFSVSSLPVADVVSVERAAFDAWRSGDAVGASRGFDEAAELWAERSFIRFAARARLTSGRVALASGDGALAAHRFAIALELSTRWRLAPIAEAARAALGALEREHRRSLLSRREVEVLELVADGRTTSQIATTLGVGDSTVVTHVNSARAKLGARTRRQAAAMVFVEAP